MPDLDASITIIYIVQAVRSNKEEIVLCVKLELIGSIFIVKSVGIGGNHIMQIIYKIIAL